MIVDGKDLAKEILARVAAQVAARPLGAPLLVAITCDPNFATQKYLSLKERTAAAVGIPLTVVSLPPTATTSDVVAAVILAAKSADGIVVQLPLPPHIDREQVLAAVPPTHDPDGFSYGKSPAACLPPVVAAISIIVERYNLSLYGKRVVILGCGRLVGAPAAVWCQAQGAEVTSFSAADPVAQVTALAMADVLITGIGVPHAIGPAQVPEGISIFDAGTSEDGGVIAGDVDPAVSLKAHLFTPVPGGIGPMTVAILLQNLLELVDRQ